MATQSEEPRHRIQESGDHEASSTASGPNSTDVGCVDALSADPPQRFNEHATAYEIVEYPSGESRERHSQNGG
jgi:hypothetical protein